MKRTAFILAGESSGDKLAACLMKTQPDYSFHGIGGPKMAAQGLISSHDYQALQIIGLSQALWHYRQLRHLLHQLVDEVCRLKPAVIYTIDAKAFSVRFAQAVKKRMAQEGWHAPLIHMVAPTIWAYGKGRVASFEDNFDGLMCLFPMEEAYFDKAKIKTSYIGHPAAYEKRLERQLPSEAPNLLLLPGSRASEINHLLPSFLEAATLFMAQKAGSVRLVTTDEMEQLVLSHCQHYDLPVTISTDTNNLAVTMSHHDLMLAASGTVTLEAALAAIPGVVAYKLNPMVAWLMKQRATITDPILPNIISGEMIYPFYFQSDVTAANLSKALDETWQSYQGQSALLAEQGSLLRAQLQRDDKSKSFEEAIATALAEMNLAQ